MLPEITLPAYLLSFLRSFGQIMLQGNAATGLLFIIGIGLSSPLMLLGAIIATLSGLLTAKYLGYDSDAIDSGLYGFNAALVGIAVFFFLPVSLVSCAFLVSGGALSAVVMHLMLIRTPCIPAFTAPFIITTWFILIIAEVSGMTDASFIPALTTGGDFQVAMRGISQVMFQGYWLTGVIFVVGIFIQSPNAAVWAVIGSALGVLTARTFHFSDELIHMGIYGFNATLVAIVFAEHYGKSAVKALLGIVLATLLASTFVWASLQMLTAPFVLASWIVIGLFQSRT